MRDALTSVLAGAPRRRGPLVALLGGSALDEADA
jgi:hypothetical protein